MLMGGPRKGEFIPDLLLARSYAAHQVELAEVLNHTVRVAMTGEPVAHSFPREALVAAASWVHEYTHFLQYVTRVQGAEYFSVRELQARATATCTRLLAKGAPSFSHRLNLPLFHFLSSDARVENSAAEAISTWRRVWCPLQLHLAESGWETDRFIGERLGRFLAERSKQPLWPKIPLGNGSEPSVMRDLTTAVALETEAWTNAFHFCSVFFPDDVVSVFNELVGWIDFENAGFGMALVHKGLDCLVPLIADLCMQQASFLTTGEPRKSKTSPSWLFDAALDECGRRYAGMRHNEVADRRREIVSHLCTTLGCHNPEETVALAIAAIDREPAAFMDTSLKKILRRGLEMRRDHPDWFTVPLIWLPELMRAVPGLRVLWNPPHTLADGTLFISLWGDRFLSPRENAELEAVRLALWAAREIAMRVGPIICPLCMIGLGKPQCSGECHFARGCKDSFGIDPVTGRPAE